MSTYLPWIFLAVTLGAAVALILVKRAERARLRARVHHQQSTETASEPQQPAEPPFQEIHLERVAVPSSLPDYDFLFSASVWWRPAGTQGTVPHGNRSGLAAAHVIRRAQEFTRNERPERHGAVQYLLEEALGTHTLDDTATLVVMATDVTLALVPEDRDRLRKLAGLRKEEDTWEQERQYERSRRKYLADEVLQTPGSAAVWWLSRHEEDIERAVELLGPFAQLSAASNNTEVATLFRHLVERPSTPTEEPTVDVLTCVTALLDLLDLSPDSPDGEAFLLRLEAWLDSVDRSEEAARLRAHFLPPTPEE
ncbi:hypothetical protein [Streptomyces sp. RerS4]|uniref:hypothetical protein n=1 Tax=Streptomyces sp. RerS4 TaxID=2942449 RepID=UPI00201C087E|nr:hypothetical protein [Streptomyces sp. RerS4]UQX02996.1 hypothetical protein M4D82_22735 [Streptomyces sp. RerS4]